MDDYELIRLQQTLCLIAREIKRICDTNNIQYSMIGGTLIGAVRHKGFIPWDDDMDFVMSRNNYDKFLEACKTQLGENFEVLNWNTNKFYGLGFTKILLKDTTAVEIGKSNAKYPQNIFVDIFPFDSIPDSNIGRFFQKTITYICIKILQQKDGSDLVECSWKKRIGFLFLRFIAKIISHKLLVRICENAMTKYKKRDTQCLTSIAGFYGYRREIVDKSLFDNYIDMTFGEEHFMAFRDYDLYLKMVFGNYMELPPIEKRRTHGFEKIDFGEY